MSDSLVSQHFHYDCSAVRVSQRQAQPVIAVKALSEADLAIKFICKANVASPEKTVIESSDSDVIYALNEEPSRYQLWSSRKPKDKEESFVPKSPSERLPLVTLGYKTSSFIAIYNLLLFPLLYTFYITENT